MKSRLLDILRQVLKSSPLLAAWLFFHAVPLAAGEAPVELTFFELKREDPAAIAARYEGKRVSIRGFLLVNEKGQPIFAAAPNVKSCCLGVGRGQKLQILLDRAPEAEGEGPMALTGLFHVAPEGERTRDNCHFYSLVLDNER